MNELSQTFGVKYPSKKLDVIAVPNYVPDKMSHLGLIILPENSLFYDNKNSSITEELKITKSISHACASMWLQNIVTSSTWDQAWIGEGLARNLEYFALGKERHDSRLMEQFVIEVYQKSLLEDSLEVKNIKIDRIASIFKMLESTVGNKNFTTRFQRFVESK